MRPSRSPKGGVSDKGGGTSSGKTGIGELRSPSSQRKRKNSGNAIDNGKHGPKDPKSKKSTATTGSSKKASLSKDESDFFGFNKNNDTGTLIDLDPPSDTVSNTISDPSSLDAGLISSSAPVIDNDTHEAQNMDFTSVSQPQTGAIEKSSNHRLTNQNRARVNLDNIETLPENTKQVMITSLLENRAITSLNPCKIELGLKELLGGIEKLEYLKSGSIIVTTKSFAQTKKLLSAQKIPKYDIPIKATVAWNRQLTYGKIYAEEFSNDTLQELLEYLTPHGVVNVRKLFRDPARAHVPLFVLTFIGAAPTHIILGSIRYSVDKYIPNVLRCRNCHRFGHTTLNCKSRTTCKKCSSIEHGTENCISVTPKCINCQGEHDSCSTSCPKFILERNICKLTADRGISFTEARNILRPRTTQPDRNQNSIIMSQSEFPNLSHSQNRTNSSQRSNHSNNSSQITNNSVINSTQKSNNKSRTNGTRSIIPATPTQYNMYSQVLHSQDEDDIPPGQITNPNYCRGNTNLNDSFNLIMPDSELNNSLPNPYHIDNLHRNSTNRIAAEHTPENRNNSLSNSSLNTTLQTILPQILPHLITILFATQLTDRIEAITKIGQLLNLDEIVNATLSGLNLSSRS